MSKKIILIRAVLILMIIATVSFIWMNSLDSAADSSKLSDGVVEKVKPVVDPEDRIERDLFVKIIRKTAHFSEFGLLGCEMFLIVDTFDKPKKYLCKVILSIAVSFPVAIVDELLQLTSDGRSCEFKDMMIDLSGITIAVIILSGIVYIAKTKLKKAG